MIRILGINRNFTQAFYTDGETVYFIAAPEWQSQKVSREDTKKALAGRDFSVSNEECISPATLIVHLRFAGAHAALAMARAAQ